MNNKRRKEITKEINHISTILQNILDEEEESYENIPESLRETERGYNSEEAQDSLNAAIDALEEAIEHLEEIN